MKSILYVGASLMVAASIYGFVDLNQSSNKKEFKTMYTEKKAVLPVGFTDVETTEPVVEKKRSSKTNKNYRNKEKSSEG